MNYYSFGNPRGTSNSEYGKFSFLSGVQGPSANQNGNIMTGSQNASWKSHNRHHQANCPNHGLSQWASQAQQGDWYQGEDGSNFTIQVGQEAANAVMGGNTNFETSFLEPQNHNGPQPTGDGGSADYQEAQPQEGTATSEQKLSNGKAQSTGQSGDHPESNAEDGTAVSEPQDSSLVQTVSKPKTVKWRGLPKRGDSQIKFGRHVLPSHMRPNQNQTQMQQNLPQRMQNHPLRTQLGQGMEIKRHLPNGYPVNKLNSTMSAMSLNGTNPAMVMPASSSMNLNSRRNMNSQASTQLCGKCSKCKNLIPPDLGPSTMTFPTKSTFRKPSSRSFHNLGQDAKNFRAIRYASRGDD